MLTTGPVTEPFRPKDPYLAIVPPSADTAALVSLNPSGTTTPRPKRYSASQSTPVPRVQTIAWRFVPVALKEHPATAEPVRPALADTLEVNPDITPGSSAPRRQRGRGTPSCP